MKYLKRLSRKLAISLALVLTVGGMLGNGMTVSAAEVVAAPKIVWDKYEPGTFRVYYEQQKDTFLFVEFYYNDTCIDETVFNYNWDLPDFQGEVYKTFYRSRLINESGKYYVKASIINSDGSTSEWSTSEILDYERPDKELCLIDVKRESDGEITFKFADEIMERYWRVLQYIDKNGEHCDDIHAKYIQVLSFDVTVYAHSPLTLVEGEIVDIVEEEKPTNTHTSEPTNKWEPTTPDEIKSFSYRSSIPVSFSVAEVFDDSIDVCNEAQGNLFIDAVESALGEYKIAATYNVSIDGQMLYETDKDIKICIKVPSSLVKDGRIFRMVTVDKEGIPYILEDLDGNSDTVTFNVDKGYAYALCYVDGN